MQGCHYKIKGSVKTNQKLTRGKYDTFPKNVCISTFTSTEYTGDYY